jgi:hypothetical protein
MANLLMDVDKRLKAVETGAEVSQFKLGQRMGEGVFDRLA